MGVEAGETVKSRGRFPTWPAVVLASALVFHAWETLRLFPTRGTLVDDAPVTVVDHAIHLYHGTLGAGFLRQHGSTWGYDPFFMAGYPETPVWDSSSNLSMLTQAAAGGYSPRAYKLGLLTFAILAWAAVPAGACAAGLSWGEAAASGASAAIVFWACVPATFWRTGLFSFVTASGGSVLVLGLALAFSRRPNWSRWALLTSAGAFWLFAHVTAPVMALGGVLGFGLSAAKVRTLGPVLAGGLVAALANLFWLVPLVRFRGIRSASLFYLAPDDPWHLLRFYRDNPLDGHVGAVLLVLGALGLAVWCLEPAGRARAATFGGAIGGLFTLTAWGGLWSVSRTMEPFRFLAALDLALVVPAASFACRGLAWASRRAAGRLVAGLVLGFVGLIGSDTIGRAARHLVQARPLVVGLRPADRELVGWLDRETDPSARVLLEDQLRLFEPTDAESTHWTPLLPVVLGSPRTFIGGLYHTAFIAHNRAASFGDYSLGGRRIDEWGDTDLTRYCGRYNVGWVVCWSPLSRFVFDRYPSARPVGTLPRPVTPGREVMRDETQWRAIAERAGPQVATRYLEEGVNRYALYRVDRPRSFLLEGTGRVVSFGFNRVELADLAPDPATGCVTLSLHWLDTWRAEPFVPLSAVPVPDDPVPFVRIKLDGPLNRLVIANRYGR